MVPRGALVFKFEEVFCGATPDYSALDDLVKKEERGAAGPARPLGMEARLRALKKSMTPKAFRQLSLLAESAAETAETQSLAKAPLMRGVGEALEAAHSSGWLVAVASDFGKVSVAKALEEKSIAKKVDLVAARTRLIDDRALSKRLLPVKRKVKSLTKVVYFCNRSREVKEAKSLGMRCMVLPSKTETFRTLLWAEPDGMILSLQELPQLLALPSMKLPEPTETKAGPHPDSGRSGLAKDDPAPGSAESGSR